MKQHTSGSLIADLTWREIRERLAAGAVALLPVGAACKEHGLHLPMNTDLVQVEWFARELAQEEDLLIWPTLSYGYYPSFVDYPGSICLTEATFINSVSEILAGIDKAGATFTLILNAGISTIPPIMTVLNRLNCDNKIRLLNLYAGPHFHRVVTAIQEQDHGSHADEIETSIMLTIAPELVMMEKAACCDAEKRAGPLNPVDPDQPNYSPSGVIGNATLATLEKGQQLVAAILTDLKASLEKN